MADQVFPYHLAGFAVGALATGYSVSSLKQYFTRPVKSMEKTAVDPNLLPQSQTRKRKRDPDVTSLPPTKRRLPQTVNTSIATDGSIPPDDLNAPSPIKSLKTTSNSEQDRVEITIGNVSSRPTHHVRTRSHYGVKLTFHERRNHTDSYATVPPRNEKPSHARVSTAKDKANEEDYHSDRTVIGDEPEHDDDGPEDSEDQSEEGNRSAVRGDENSDFDDRIGGGPGLESHEEADDDRADHAKKRLGFREKDDEDDLDDDEQENGGTCDEVIRVNLYRRSKKMDLGLSQYQKDGAIVSRS